jgi:hypothetical protein
MKPAGCWLLLPDRTLGLCGAVHIGFVQAGAWVYQGGGRDRDGTSEKRNMRSEEDEDAHVCTALFRLW